MTNLVFLIVSHSITLTLTFLPPSSIFKDPCNYMDPIQIIQDNLHILKSIDEQTQFLLQPSSHPWHITYLYVLRIQYVDSGNTIIQPTSLLLYPQRFTSIPHAKYIHSIQVPRSFNPLDINSKFKSGLSSHQFKRPTFHHLNWV